MGNTSLHPTDLIVRFNCRTLNDNQNVLDLLWQFADTIITTITAKARLTVVIDKKY